MQAKGPTANAQRWRSGDHSLRLRVGRIVRGKKLGVFPFTIENTGNYPYPITTFQLQDRLKRPVTTSFHIRGDVLGEDSLLMPGTQVQGAFVLEAPAQIKNGWGLSVNSIEAVAGAFWNNYPPDYEFIPGKLELRTMVALHAQGGSMSLSDHLGLQRSGWGVLTGAGLRVAYGPSRYTAIDGGADFLQTSEVILDTGQGDVRTSSTGGRIHIGGMLHAGHKVTPYVRLGLGVTFANHRFSMADTNESQFRLAGVMLFSAGVDWWITDRFAVGLGMGSSVPLGGQDTGLAFEAGLRAGIAFGKLRDHWRLN